MDEKNERLITIIFYSVFFVILAALLLQNLQDPWMLFLLSGLLLASFTSRNAVVYGGQMKSTLGKVLFLIDISLIFLITQIDQGSISHMYYYIVIGDAYFAYSAAFGGLASVVCFIASTAGRLIGTEQFTAGLVSDIAFELLAFLAVNAILFIAKYEMRQREKLSGIMYELKIKSKQLEGAYLKLKQTSEELEEVTALRERNRLAREIHDTVGHTLTSILLEMEAGERLLGTDRELALEKFSLAKGQVRKGLNDIRESVSTLRAGMDCMDFIPSLKLLISEITRHGDIHVRSDLPELPELNPSQKKALYRALQEGLTNGIRHGGSTAFVFQLHHEDGYIHFFLQDNGKGTDRIIRGFGLTSMNERIRELGGVLSLDSKPDEGFSIKIGIPVAEETANG
jgi:signal transduction histidine kinase